LDQIFIGWTEKFEQAIWGPWADETTKGIKLFWNRMGCDDSVGAALTYTYDHYPSTTCWETMWWANHDLELLDDNGDDNIFIHGLGVVKLYTIKLKD
jgi:hypothetical protein